MRLLATILAAAAIAAVMAPDMRIRLETGSLVRMMAGASIGALVWLVALDAGAPPAAAGATAALTTPLPAALASGRRRRAAAALGDRWPDFIAAVRSRIASGSPIPDASRAAARHLGGRFALIDGGPAVDFADAIERARAEWSDPIADRVLMTLVFAARVGGGSVDAMLGRLARSVAAELRVRRDHAASLTQQRLTAIVALLAPWAILWLSITTNPTAAAAFSSAVGSTIVLAGLAATAIGFIAAMHTARLSRPSRPFA